jgi:hypothetical protein
MDIYEIFVKVMLNTIALAHFGFIPLFTLGWSGVIHVSYMHELILPYLFWRKPPICTVHCQTLSHNDGSSTSRHEITT